jgi:type IV secretion system protein VirB4
MHNSSTGKKDGNHWGENVIQLKTTSNTPYYFNFHEHDVGHTRITTGTGGGKTTVINTLLTASDKFKPYIFHFDFEYSASVWIKSMGEAPLQSQPLYMGQSVFALLLLL